ncbi:MAG: DUF389 domain-containing protein [Clostridiales bacterium]|nr:DUF389 domain-containing protein [Clostridiales bacterium]
MKSEEKNGTGIWPHVKAYFARVFDIHSDMMSYEEINDMMEENTVIQGSNMWILIMAILIASIGLNVNSTAVIIGAMLISPLMSGILTMGYSLAVRDLDMLKKALGRFGTQVAISLAASTLYFIITPLDAPTAEMIARTSPTIWDVLIALFGGIAGIIGNTRKKKGNVIPGVAIATALMPPLCTAGYGIATLQPRFIFGALYLFLINTMFIALSAAEVSVILRVPIHKNISPKRQKRINRIIGAITIVVVIPSLFIGAYTVYSSVMERNIQNYLNNEFIFENTQLVQSSTDTKNKHINVSLVGQTISDDVIKRLEQALTSYSLDDYTLHITQNSISAADVDNSDKITIAIQENTISELQAQLAEAQERLDEFENSAAAKLDFNELAGKAESIFTVLSDCSCGITADENGEYIVLAANTNRMLSAPETRIIENWLKTESGIAQVRLFFNK